MNKNQHLTQMRGGLSCLSSPLQILRKSCQKERFLVCFPKEMKLMQSSSALTFRPLFNL